MMARVELLYDEIAAICSTKDGSIVTAITGVGEVEGKHQWKQQRRKQRG
jgi:hypothetical protein